MPKILYKLTDSEGRTRNSTQWGEGITHEATGNGRELCSNGLIHAYESPLLAVLLGPIHAKFENPSLWEATTKSRIIRDGQLKCGVRSLTTTRKIDIPEVSITQRVAFGILCALEVERMRNSQFVIWAENWLSGKNRYTFTATTVAGELAIGAAAHAAAVAAAFVNRDAVYTAYAAAYAAYAVIHDDGGQVNLISIAEKSTTLY